jgi:predicted nucleic acid-binding protein
MSARYLLDTNIFVYSFATDDPAKNRTACRLIDEALHTGKGLVSYQSVQEFFNVALRRFTPPIKVDEAQRYFSTVFRPLLAVHSSPALYLEALQLYEQHKLSWYDGLIVASAVLSECEILYSEDFQDGRRFGALRVQNPFVQVP